MSNVITLREYANYIKNLALSVDNPEEIKMCFSSDTEGNYFEELYIGPELGELTLDGFIGEEESTDVTHCCVN